MPDQDHRYSDAEIEALWRTMRERRDMRHFLPPAIAKPLPDGLIERLVLAAHLAPSVGFMQPWRFILQREDVLLLGPPGTGKSHLAQALGRAAIHQGHRVAYREAHTLLEEITDATLPISRCLRRPGAVARWSSGTRSRRPCRRR